MKKIIFILLLTSCSTIQSSVPLEDRVYDIHPDLNAFIWGHVVCVKKFLGICTKKALKLEKVEVEFKNKEQARQLFDMNFVLRQRKKPL